MPSDATAEDLDYLKARQGQLDDLDSIQNNCFLFGVTATLQALDGTTLGASVDAGGNCPLGEPLPPIGALIEIIVR